MAVDWKEWIKTIPEAAKLDAALTEVRTPGAIDLEASACSSLAINLLTGGLMETITLMQASAGQRAFELDVTNRSILASVLVVMRVLGEKFRITHPTIVEEAIKMAINCGPSVEKMFNDISSAGVVNLSEGVVGITLPEDKNG